MSHFCTTKILCSTAAQRYVPNAPPGEVPGKVPNDPTSLLSRDGSDCCCDGCLEVRDGLGVLLIHPVLEVTPQMEPGGFRSGEYGVHSRLHLRLANPSLHAMPGGAFGTYL